MSLANRVQEFRKSKKLTQQALADLASVDYNTLRKVETGKTENPSAQFIDKIAKALNISASQILEAPKQHTFGGAILPFSSLSADDFERLILWVVQSHQDFTEPEPYGGRGDKSRDVIAKKQLSQHIPSGKYTLFQAKCYTKITSPVLIAELENIKKHFFDIANNSTPIEAIYFCVANSPSAAIKDKVKAFARDEGLPDPVFWEARTLDAFCKKEKHIINEFFGGHFQELKTDIKSLDTNLNHNFSLMGNKLDQIHSSMVIVTAADDASMQRASRMISNKEYKVAQQILLELKNKIESCDDKDRLKRLYNNLGICFTNSESTEDVMQGIEYLKSATDLDFTFSAPKQNLIEVIISKSLTAQYTYAQQLAKELHEQDPHNAQYKGLYALSLNVCGQDSILENFLSNSKDLFSSDENLCVTAVLFYARTNKTNECARLIELGLKHFPDSPPLNQVKGQILMISAQESGAKFREFDTLPLYRDLSLVEKAIEHFKIAFNQAKISKYASGFIKQISFELYSALAFMQRGRNLNNENLRYLVEIENGIYIQDLPKNQKSKKSMIDISRKLEIDHNYHGAYQLYVELHKNFNLEYESIKILAKQFLSHGSPENAIKIITSLEQEAKEKSDFEYWAILSVCYALLEDKNSALRTMNDAKRHFASANKLLYSKIISHYAALTARYKDNSETNRLVKNLLELHVVSPQQNILQSIKAIDDDGNLSEEVLNFLSETKKIFEKKRELFISSPIPVYFLKKIFSRPFPEAVKIPSENYDFDFILPYNSLDEDFIAKQKNAFDNNTIIVLDYSALLNLARSGHLALLNALEKQIYVSEYLFFEVQSDLAKCESKDVRDAWNFLRSGKVNFFSEKDVEEFTIRNKLTVDLDEWLIQTIEFCVNKMAVLLTDDLRLWRFMYSEDVKGKAINTLMFYKNGLRMGLLDKTQYSLALADLADMFYYFIPFDGDDLINIALDDERRTSSINDEFKISRRLYHLLNQARLPGSDVTSFLNVCLDFLNKLIRLSVTEETKIDWVVFLTNFFIDSILEDNSKSQVDLAGNLTSFTVSAWQLLKTHLPESYHEKILKKTEEIKSNDLKSHIQNIFQNF